MDMQRSLKKRCCADQKSLNTSRLCPVSSTASLKAPLRSCTCQDTIHHSQQSGTGNEAETDRCNSVWHQQHTCQTLPAASYKAVCSAVSSHLSSMNSAFLQAYIVRGVGSQQEYFLVLHSFGLVSGQHYREMYSFSMSMSATLFKKRSVTAVMCALKYGASEPRFPQGTHVKLRPRAT